MGLFSWVGSKVWGGVKRIAKAVVAGAEKLCAGVAKTWGAFSGKTKAEEAKRRYEALEERIRVQQRELQRRHDALVAEIHQYLDVIGQVRRCAITVSFRRFEQLAGCFAEWDVTAHELVETFVSSINVNVSRIKTKGEVLKIDFDAHPVAETLKCLFTLGFSTRKRAQESLNQVAEQEAVFKDSLSNAEAGLTQLEQIAGQMKHLSVMVSDLQDTYDRLLTELEYAIHMLRSHVLVAAPAHSVAAKMDCYFLPEAHLKCLMACEKMTRIMQTVCVSEIFKKDGQVESSEPLRAAQRELVTYMAA